MGNKKNKKARDEKANDKKANDKKAKEKKAGKSRRAAPSDPGSPAFNGILILVILANAVYLVMPIDASSSSSAMPGGNPASSLVTITTPPPNLEYKQSQQTGKLARFDHQALITWCNQAQLPQPPDLGWIESQVGDAIAKALNKVVAQRSGENLGLLGKIYEGMDCHQVAMELFQLAAGASPKDFRWPYYEGCIHQLLGRNPEALNAFATAESLHGNYPVLHARVGQLHLEAGEHQLANQRFSTYAQLNPNDSLGFTGLGRVALKQGRYQYAMEQLSIAVSKGPNDFQAHHYLAKAYDKLGNAAVARRLFAAAAAMPQGKWFYMRDPLDQELHRASGSTQSLISEFEMLSGLKDFTKLAALAEKVIERRPTDTMMLCNLANIYKSQKRYDEAHRLLNRALEIQPGMARAYLVRGALNLSQGNHAAAIADADFVLKFKPEDHQVLSIKGRALFLMQKFSEAEPVLRKAVNVNPTDVGNQYVLGEAVLRLGRRNEAMEIYREILKVSPEFQPALQRVQELSGG